MTCQATDTQETASAKNSEQMGLTCCFRVARKVSMYRTDRALGAGNRELKSHLQGHKGPGDGLCPGRQPASAAVQQREQKEQQTHQSPMTRRMVNQCSCRAEGDCSAGCMHEGACLLNGCRAVSSRTLRYAMRVVAGTAEFAAAPALCVPSLVTALTLGCAQDMM